MEICVGSMDTIDVITLCNAQKWDKMWKKVSVTNML